MTYSDYLEEGIVNQKIKNYLQYEEQIVTVKEVVFDFLHLGIIYIFYQVFYCGKVCITIPFAINMLLVTVTGVCSIGKKNEPCSYLYRGITNMSISVRYYMLSWLFAITSGGNPVFTTASYITVFTAICVSICIGISLLIKKDAYNTECGKANHYSAYRGAIIAVLLCPVIFAHTSENIVYVIISVCMLIIGVFMQFSINYLLKFILKQARQ